MIFPYNQTVILKWFKKVKQLSVWFRNVIKYLYAPYWKQLDMISRNGFLPVHGHSTELGPQAHLHRTFNLISPNSLQLEIEKWIKLYTKLN